MKNPPSQTYVNIGSALLITFLEKTNYQLPFPGQRSAEPVLDASNVTVSAEPVDEAQKEEDDAEKPVVPLDKEDPEEPVAPTKQKGNAEKQVAPTVDAEPVAPTKKKGKAEKHVVSTVDAEPATKKNKPAFKRDDEVYARWPVDGNFYVGWVQSVKKMKNGKTQYGVLFNDGKIRTLKEAHVREPVALPPFTEKEAKAVRC